jgi:hypothetical protein
MAAAKRRVRSTNRLRLIFFSALAAVVGGAALTGHNDPATAGGATNLVPTFASPVPSSGLMPSTPSDPTAAFPLPSFAAVPLPTVVLPPPKPVFPVPTVAAVPVPASPTGSATTCGADFYRNVDGNCVQRPTAVAVPPFGATAQCADGTYSFSQHRQGTCSHHGGVATGP